MTDIPRVKETSLQFKDIEPPFWTNTSWIQMGYGFLVSQIDFAVALTFAFSAVLMPQLKHPSSKLQVNVSEEAWITSILTMLTPIGCVPSGYLSDRYGRKCMLYVSCCPIALGWIVISFATGSAAFIVGRAICGIGNGIAIATCRTYTTEITLPKMRGVIGTLPNLFFALGVTTMSVLGSFLKWPTICYVCCIHLVIFFVVAILIPDTPYFILKTKSASEAKKCLQKFRAKNHKIDEEMHVLITFKTNNDIRRLTTREQLAFLLTKAACRPFTIMTTYLMLGQSAGVTVLTFFTIDILEASNTSISAYTANTILGITRFFGAILLSCLVFKYRRRPLALISSVGVGMSALLVGVYVCLHKDSPTIIPLCLFEIYMVFASLGYYSLPMMMIYELLPLQIRGLLGAVTLSLLQIAIFVVNYVFPYVHRSIGYGLTYVLFGISSFVCCLHIYFFLPETKGLGLTEIEEALQERIMEKQRRSMQNTNA